MDAMEHFDVCIAGAGIIGLSLSLELRRRGRSVMVVERGRAMRESSWAAAGMLAADDPELPTVLREMAQLSAGMYPEFLNRIQSLSGHSVRFRTVETLLGVPPRSAPQANCAPIMPMPRAALKYIEPLLAPADYKWRLLREASIDPRDLCAALPAAFATACGDIFGGGMLEMTEWLPSFSPTESAPEGGAADHIIPTRLGDRSATTVVDCRGAWADISGEPGSTGIRGRSEITPRKGQALTIALPSGMPLTRTIRTGEVYIVPRGDGRALIGATMEDAGFDKSTDDASIAELIGRADALVPGIAQCAVLERWAGLRPLSSDGLPVLGAVPGRPGHFIASGHFWDGILLAPATALVMAQLVCAEAPSIDLAPFSPARFQSTVGQG